MQKKDIVQEGARYVWTDMSVGRVVRVIVSSISKSGTSHTIAFGVGCFPSQESLFW